jgi:hypothetical protein
MILDPCCRNNEFKFILGDLGYYVIGTDLKQDELYDATKYKYWAKRFPDFVITQPPANDKSIDIIKSSLSRSRLGAIFYLPMSWLVPDSLSKETLLATNYHVVTLLGHSEYCFVHFPKDCKKLTANITYLLQ